MSTDLSIRFSLLAGSLATVALTLACSRQATLPIESGQDASDSDGGTTVSAETEESTDDGPVEGQDETDDDDPGFVPAFDVIGDPICDPWLQDCPEGEKCSPYASDGGGVWSAHKCVPVLGDAAVGEPCEYDGIVEATDTCDADSGCWNVVDVDGVLVGTCHAFCSGTPDDPWCPPGSACSISGDGTINYCIPDCDPLAQDCGEGLGCYWSFDSFQCVFTASNFAEGEPCGYVNDCAPGNICVAAETVPSCEGPSCCAGLCDLDAPVCPVEGTACTALFDEVEGVGACLVP